VSKIKEKLVKWVMKDMPLPIQPIIVENQSLKRFRAQRIVPYREYLFYENREGADIKTFKFDIANELLNEIIIKQEEVPDGIKYSCDLLFENI
jgi:hypothetical protein